MKPQMIAPAWAAVLLLVLGLLRMAGDVAGVPAVAGLAAASGASPAPKVFTAVDGFETYSTRFFVQWQETGGTVRSLELDPVVYARLGGPYNRRNVYGAVIAYGPVLKQNPHTRELVDSVLRYGLCGDAPLLEELGIDTARIEGRAWIRLEPIGGSDLGDLPDVLEVECP